VRGGSFGRQGELQRRIVVVKEGGGRQTWWLWRKEKKKNRQKEARCQIGKKEKDTKRQSALWRVGRRRTEKNW
jgi:hypothetical protein